MTQLRSVAVVAANRLPFARQNTAYHGISNQTMLTDTLEGLVKKAHLDGALLGEVAGGAVLKHSRDWNLLRECVLGTSLDAHTPAYDVQQACCTSLEATILVANKIALGQIDSGIACGTDTTSDAPVSVNPRFQRGLMDLHAARSIGARAKALAQMAHPANLALEVPGIREPRTGKTMGEHAQITADEMGVGLEDPRTPHQDGHGRLDECRRRHGSHLRPTPQDAGRQVRAAQQEDLAGPHVHRGPLEGRSHPGGNPLLGQCRSLQGRRTGLV